MSDRPKQPDLLTLLGTLNDIIEERLAATHDLLEHVAVVVRENTEEVGVLRDAIDEFRELVEWAILNDRLEDVMSLSPTHFDATGPQPPTDCPAPTPEPTPEDQRPDPRSLF